jgi:hypothetical protein
MMSIKYFIHVNAQNSGKSNLKSYGHSPTVVIDHIFSQLFTQLAQNNVLVEEFTLVAMLEVFSDSLPHISR